MCGPDDHREGFDGDVTVTVDGEAVEGDAWGNVRISGRDRPPFPRRAARRAGDGVTRG
jgi:hypothetical protein